MSSRRRAAQDRPGSRSSQARTARILVFLQGTVLMHSGGRGRSPKERVAQVREHLDPSVRDHATYVPIGQAAAKLQRWHGQGAQIDYLSSNRDPVAIAHDASILRRYDFPEGRVLARGPGEGYGDVAGRELPDLLVEDDCQSIGSDEITYPQIPPERRSRIKSIIVPEFGGIDHLPDSLETLLTLEA